MIDINKTYRTRNGQQVRIYATDVNSFKNIHGAAKSNDGLWLPYEWFCDGTHYNNRSLDLIEVKPRIRRPYWINIYQPVCGTETAYFCKSQADHYAQPGRLACVKVEIDCEEGEGL